MILYNKMENLTHLSDLLHGGEYLISLDLKDAYFTTPTDEDHSMFLRLEWQSQLLEFTCLSSAPKVFTKVMKPIAWLLCVVRVSNLLLTYDLVIISASYTTSLA